MGQEQTLKLSNNNYKNQSNTLSQINISFKWDKENILKVISNKYFIIIIQLQ